MFSARSGASARRSSFLFVAVLAFAAACDRPPDTTPAKTPTNATATLAPPSGDPAQIAPTKAPHEEPGPKTEKMPLGTPPPTKIITNPDGTQTVLQYHANGNLYVEFGQKTGPDGKPMRHGLIRAWHENGEQQQIGSYRDGKLSGHWRYWDDMGHLEREGDYDESKREGEWKEFYPLGQLKSAGLYHVDWREGPWKTWHSNGKLESEGEYINNKREGVWKFWLEDGSVDTDHTGVWKDNHRVQ